ncbi:MAG: ABC transporter permease [Chloroflexota bacterium]
MLRVIVPRIVHGVIVLLLVSVITFFLVNLAPGGPSAIVRMDMTAEQRAALTKRMGLDQPVPVRYVLWLGQAVQGDFGTSLASDEAVSKRIAQRLPNTLVLAGLALGLSVLAGIPMGVIAALRRNTWIDHMLSLVSALGLSIPAFWFGIMLILVFSVSWQLLPSSGMETTGQPFSLGDRLVHLVMPTIVLATTILPSIVRFMRSSLLDVVHQDYIRTAKGKGLGPFRVIFGHALRNAIAPVISIIGTLVPRLVGGAVITEAVFGWPGMGRLAVEAANGRDYPLVMGITMVIAVVVVICTLLVDLAYTWIDPRVRLQ